MKNSSDTIGNRTRDLPACSAVPQPTALPRTPRVISTGRKIINSYLGSVIPGKSVTWRAESNVEE